MKLDRLIDAVNSVSNEEDVSSLARQFGLQREESPNKFDQVLGLYKGVVEGRPVTIIHRWYDRCKTFQIQPDGNKVEREVDGRQVAVGSFLDDF